MQKELKLVEEFHKKFKAPVAEVPTLISKSRSSLRYELMKEEVEEYLTDGVNSLGRKDKKIENIAKELADILYTVYGTILEHGLQNKMEEIFLENHRSQMSKKYSPGKMIKGKNFKEVDIKQIIKK
jgi:predicted HAD superfamily Cof-like phosphohydrolase